MTGRNRLGFPPRDLRMEFIVNRGTDVSIHWSKLKVRDLDNIRGVWYPLIGSSGDASFMSYPNAHSIPQKLGQIPAMREHTSNLSSNRMRDLGLIQYHDRERMRRKKDNTT